MTTRILSQSAFALAASAGLFATTASAQMSFSFDHHGPSRSAPDCTGVTMTEGDILTPCSTLGVPSMPLVPGALPPPSIFHSAGPVGLALPGYSSCAGAPPAALCPLGIEVDALSYGLDTILIPQFFDPASPIFLKGGLHFSVDEFAVGAPGPADPSVFSEGMISSEAATDVFRDLGIATLPPAGPGTGIGNHAQFDGNGRRSMPTYWAYDGVGLIEPSPAGPPPNLGDNLDALDTDLFGATGYPAYYSLDSALIDPRTGTPGSGSAPAIGFSGADVLVTIAAGAGPALFAPAPALGLDFFGPDTDDLDALVLSDNGNGTFDASFNPFDWIAGGRDMLLFSVREGSAVIGAPDSFFGIPIEAGDILSTPFPGGVSPFPSIFIAAENLGLSVSAARGGSSFFGDDLDALDFSRQPTLFKQEYCFGDGGMGPGCTACPCGNDMPAGTQSGCMNSAGSGARLETSGFASLSADTLRFEITGATPSSFAMLTTGTLRLPLAGPCPPGSGTTSPVFDGLRCFGGGFLRYPARPTDAAGTVGMTTPGWGAPDGPPGGILAFYGFAACTTRQWQALYRDSTTFGCGTGINTTQGVQTMIVPF